MKDDLVVGEPIHAYIVPSVDAHQVNKRYRSIMFIQNIFYFCFIIIFFFCISWKIAYFTFNVNTHIPLWGYKEYKKYVFSYRILSITDLLL